MVASGEGPRPTEALESAGKGSRPAEALAPTGRGARPTEALEPAAVQPRTIADLVVHDRAFAGLDPSVLYALLRLRVDVFVVEQACAYPELDGRDLEPATRHVWLAPVAQPDEPAAYLRILQEPSAVRRIGRVVTVPDQRGQGLGRALLAWALEEYPGVVVLDAQSHLEPFYAALGFAVDGPAFVEDGIPHVPMRRDG